MRGRGGAQPTAPGSPPTQGVSRSSIERIDPDDDDLPFPLPEGLIAQVDSDEAVVRLCSERQRANRTGDRRVAESIRQRAWLALCIAASHRSVSHSTHWFDIQPRLIEGAFFYVASILRGRLFYFFSFELFCNEQEQGGLWPITMAKLLHLLDFLIKAECN